MSTPDVLIVQDPGQKPQSRLNLPSKKISLAILITVLLIASAVFIFNKSTNKPQTTPKPFNQKTNNSTKIEPEKDILETAKLIFTSDKEKTILNDLLISSQKRDLNTKYQYYLKAYTKMFQVYQSSSNLTVRALMSRLKTYLSIYPGYKESDFPKIK